MDRKIDDLNPILRKITRLVAAIKSLRLALFIILAIISQLLDGAGNCNHSLCKTRTHLSSRVYTMVADVLVMQGPWALIQYKDVILPV